MGMYRYGEEQNVAQLDRLPRKLRVAFACVCAERLLPSFVEWAHRTGRDNPNELSAILARVWTDLQDDVMTTEEIRLKADACMALVPEEDEGQWVDVRAYAEDAAAAVAYALRCRESGKSQEAAWAARRAYEAVDHYVINRLNIDTNRSGAEERVLTHPLVQAELGRQQRDLVDLVRIADLPASNLALSLAEFRRLAKAEAADFFQL